MPSLPIRASRKSGGVGFSALVVIPARLGSTRLPRKPLAEIAGEPMIAHVWRSAFKAAEAIGGVRVVVAVDAPELLAVVEAAGGIGVMTGSHHASGTDRVFEALERIDSGSEHDIIVNLQGDMPDFPAAGLAKVLEALARDASADIATLVGRLRDANEASDPHIVKAVLGEIRKGFATVQDFTREPAPWDENDGGGRYFHHIGVYAYRRAALQRFVSLPPSPREVAERLEQLRALEDGMSFTAALLEETPVGVDTPEDLEEARKRFSKESNK